MGLDAVIYVIPVQDEVISFLVVAGLFFGKFLFRRLILRREYVIHFLR